MKITSKFQATAYVYWYSKIKSKTNGRYVTLANLKEIIVREILCDNNKNRKGGNKKGIPKRFFNLILKDLEGLTLIKKVNHYTYEILPSNCDKLLEDFPF